MFDLSTDLSLPFTLWSGLLGGMFLSLGTHGADQMMVQRYLCARSRRDAGRALILSGGVVLLQFLIFLLIGVGLAAYYAESPPAQAFQKADEVFTTFIIQGLPPGAIGIILAAVLAAAMSTLSSSLNSSASSALNDLYIPLAGVSRESPRLVWLTRILTVVFGVIQIGIAMLGPRFGSSIVTSVLSIAGIATGIILGVFFLGTLTRRTSQRAALTGLAVGLLVMACVVFGTSLGTGWETAFGESIVSRTLQSAGRLAWPWYTVLGSLTTFGVGLLCGRMKDGL
jgi:Na+/proline symporter